MAFNFAFGASPWSPRAFLHAVQRWETALGPDRWPSVVLSDHDGAGRHVGRYGGRYPDAVAKVAAAMLLTLRGTPFVYYGDEIALPPAPIRRSEILDPVSKHYWPFYSRDPGRAPLPWNDAPNGGFTTGRPWLPLHPGYPQRNVEAQRADPNSVLTFYRKLIDMRRESAALRAGSFVNLTARPRHGWAYLREAPEGRALIGLNFSNREMELQLDRPVAGRWELALSSAPRPPAGFEEDRIRLAPFEAAVFLQGK